MGEVKIYFGKILQDGKLNSTSGRIVIYGDFIEMSHGPARDHNDLLRALAAKYRLPIDDVISGAARLYWDKLGEDIVVCPVRKIDEELFYARKELNAELIAALLR